MPTHISSILGAMFSLAAVGLAIYFWRRSTGLYQLLVEGANRFEELRARNSGTEEALSTADEKLNQHQVTIERLAHGLDEARNKAHDLARRLEQKEHEARHIAEKLELQKGHLERQLTKAHDMLKLAEEQRQAAETDRATAKTLVESGRRQIEQERAANAQELQLKEKEFKLKIAETEKSAQAKASGDPVEIKRLKRKLAQFDRLYASMKGLREMTEERNRNWEVALRRLAVWVLGETGKGRGGIPDAIGPLVGHALQAIGAQLIDDNAEETVAGASITHDMDEDRAQLSLDHEEEAKPQTERPAGGAARVRE